MFEGISITDWILKLSILYVSDSYPVQRQAKGVRWMPFYSFLLNIKLEFSERYKFPSLFLATLPVHNKIFRGHADGNHIVFKDTG
jgi:hypothetical protein